MMKCLENCIGKYINGTGLEDALIECKLVKKTIEQVLNGTHHVGSLGGIIILSEAIEKLKWDAFSKVYGKEKYSNITSLNNLALELLNQKQTARDILKNAKMILKYYNRILSRSQKNVLKNQNFVGTGMV